MESSHEKRLGSNELEGARRWCALQERSTQDLVRRLQKRGVSAGEISALCATLEEEGFLDRDRFAASYIRAHAVQKGWGPEKIVAGLRERGYTAGEARTGLGCIPPETWREMLQRLVARRPWNTVEDRARNIRWLQQRGFRWEDIQRALPDGPVDEG